MKDIIVLMAQSLNINQNSLNNILNRQIPRPYAQNKPTNNQSQNNNYPPQNNNNIYNQYPQNSNYQNPQYGNNYNNQFNYN